MSSDSEAESFKGWVQNHRKCLHQYVFVFFWYCEINVLERQLSLLQALVPTCKWITDFLTNRSQQVKLGSCISSSRPTNTGSLLYRAASFPRPRLHSTPTAAPFFSHRSSSCSLQMTPPWWASYPGGMSLRTGGRSSGCRVGAAGTTWSLML